MAVWAEILLVGSLVWAPRRLRRRFCWVAFLRRWTIMSRSPARQLVNSIQEPGKKVDHGEMDGSDQKGSLEKNKDGDDGAKQEKTIPNYPFLPLRKRISLTKMSENSIWVTGESGMIYERFWNGLQWVVAPHALPVYAGYAVSVFLVNQKILALSEAGHLYQMQLNENSQPIWVELILEFDKATIKETVQLSSGVITNDRERIYFCTKDGILLEVLEIDPPSWANHGRPPGANVAAITDVATIRQGLLFIVSSAGDLYEYDQTSKPPWKKHIRQQGSTKDTALASSRACGLHGLVGAHSMSLFFLTKGGELIERRLNQRKWKWVVHGNPKAHVLTSITCISQDEPNENSNPLFVTTAAGFVFQYRIQQNRGNSQDQGMDENWVNHNHPPQARAARGVSGLQLQPGRMIFPLDDGRLAELHLSGLGGESLGPNTPVSTRRKSVLKYVWSILDAPESEGWNAEYCTEEHGPTNCILGTKGETGEISVSRWRKDSRAQSSYLIPSTPDIGTSSGLRQYDYERIDKLFHLRLMHEEKSFFLITGNGETFECLKNENVWFWLRHEHSTGMRGVVGKYNGSLFLVDENGSLLARERSGDDLAWINCTSMRRGKAVIGGRPWDGLPGRQPRAQSDDALFFVSTSGRLLQLSVALRKFKWKCCKNPPGTKIASIVDQEGFRDQIVFVVGENGRLYQYNKISGLWHEHYQSQHLVLSRSPGTAVRPSVFSPRGSIFMLSEDGGLVEYKWSSADGWNWIEHGQPGTNVTLVGAPGPCFRGTELFLIGSDGNVYRRYLDQGEWKWEDCGFPYIAQEVDGNERQVAEKARNDESCDDGEIAAGFENVDGKFRGIDKNCNPKVSSTRPIPLSEDSLIFQLQDGRLAEMSRMDDRRWIWSRTIATPMSLCTTNYWTSWA
ncbi:hypothetical protein PHJA_002267200 [Phtheirospermum japonicum]|uniref:Uncharacterized protein n=1 Tax=Phtheirospermum japonicum TaxID=374723 RepID=A0A830CSP7_9LAMI|nr:hypothetical protein PHJA_002267200 [Phtheirospermum japonicum]